MMEQELVMMVKIDIEKNDDHKEDSKHSIPGDFDNQNEDNNEARGSEANNSEK